MAPARITATFLTVRAQTLIPLVVLLFFTVRCSERFASFYETREAAEKDGAIDRGWLPECLPESSVRIHEEHDIDTNETWAIFEFDRADSASFRAKLTPVGVAEINGRMIRKPRALAEWKAELIGPLQWDRVRATGLEPHKCIDSSSDEELFFVDWSRSNGFMWRPAR